MDAPRAPARASSASASASSGDSSRTASPSSAYCRGGAPGLCSHRGSRRAPVDVRAEDSEGAAAVARGGCANDGAVGDARGCARRRAPAHAVSPGPVPRVTASGALLASPARALGVRGGRRGLPGAAGDAGGAPADAGEARPRQTAVEARGGPAPRDGRRGRGFASGSRARAPRARPSPARARGHRSPCRRAPADGPPTCPRETVCATPGFFEGEESTHTRFLGWRGPVPWLVFFHLCRRQESNTVIKKTLSPPRREPRCAQLPAQRTTCEHERRSW